MAGQVAKLLQGKHKPTYVPHSDCGDYVVIVNAGRIKFTGNKLQQKLYRWHSGFPGGLKSRPAWMQLQRNPVKLVRDTVAGMLPKNNLRKYGWMKKLRVYSGPEHPHTEDVAADTAAASYKEHYAPTSKKLLKEVQPIPYYTDALESAGEEDGPQIPAEIMEGIFAFRMRAAVDAEVAFWAAKGEDSVPQRVLEQHGLQQVGAEFKDAETGEALPAAADVAKYGEILAALEAVGEDEAAWDALVARLEAGEDITASSGAGAAAR